MLKEIRGEAEISEPLRIFCKNSQMMNSCHILWRTGKGGVGCLSLRAGGRSLWGSVGPPVQHQFLQKHWSENQTPGREQGRSSCQHRFVKLVLFPYVTGWQISLTEANACLVTVSPAERSQASAASVWSRQISCVGITKQAGKHYSENMADYLIIKMEVLIKKGSAGGCCGPVIAQCLWQQRQ